MIKEKNNYQRGEELRGNRKVVIYGGRAGYNSVAFTGERYQSMSRFHNRKITTAVGLIRENNKITIILSTLPFVRSFSIVIDLIIEYWRRFLVAVIVLFLLEFLFIPKSDSIFSYTIQINGLEMLLGLLIIAGLIIKISPIGAYHAAEHMVFSAYEKNLKLTLENVRKQPRTHSFCGTNLVISYFICFSILFMVFGDSFWVYLIAWIFGFELYKSEPKIIWGSILVIGKVAQYLLFTSRPKEKHLIVAIEALAKLEEEELANLCDEDRGGKMKK
ncbi:DUF1385 domain-containing protein [Fredinandcohnia onubensis]|uniref:DUF1385 domain-containing protein n=1 Tax=Fredinandcohnia onubensis TaxID=1571209 RepID=UPI000C0C03B5|nr:DUF1385 domain-containing protein [Fredinandcohnia onubensis]